MRHYYDVYCLLQVPDVQNFIGTAEYQAHKQKRFRSADNPLITENEAFMLRTQDTRQLYTQAYDETVALYYQEQPTFNNILKAIADVAEAL